MCIVIHKPKNKTLPLRHLANSFHNNGDGAGFMFALDGKVHGLKGFMKWQDMLDALRTLGVVIAIQEANLFEMVISDQLDMVFHFRIATAGKVDPSTTHPFPLRADVDALRALRWCDGAGFAHNGTITALKGGDDLSDSQKFIMEYVGHKQVRRAIRSAPMQKLITEAAGIGNKLLFMLGNGEVIRTGAWEVVAGVFYSNSTYSYRYYSRLDDWENYYDYRNYPNYQQNRYLRSANQTAASTHSAIQTEMAKVITLPVKQEEPPTYQEVADRFNYSRPTLEKGTKYVSWCGYRDNCWQCEYNSPLHDEDGVFAGHTCIKWEHYIESKKYHRYQTYRDDETSPLDKLGGTV